MKKLLIPLLLLAGCATGPDRTPDRQETKAVSRAAYKVIVVPCGLVFGLVTWIPVGLWVVAVAPENTLEALAWPYYTTSVAWVMCDLD